MLLSLLNLPFRLGCQHGADPVGQGAVVEFARTLPDCPFVFIVRQWVGRFANAFFLHTSMVYTLNQYCTDVCRVYTMRRTRMAFAEGCQNNRITGKPDSAPCNNLPLLLGAFSCTEAI